MEIHTNKPRDQFFIRKCVRKTQEKGALQRECGPLANNFIYNLDELQEASDSQSLNRILKATYLYLNVISVGASFIAPAIFIPVSLALAGGGAFLVSESHGSFDIVNPDISYEKYKSLEIILNSKDNSHETLEDEELSALVEILKEIHPEESI